MVTGIFGESCTGKSTLAAALAAKTGAAVYTGKDYVRLAKNELDAQRQFAQLLKENETGGDAVIYVISEKEHLALLPEKALRVLVCAPLDVIKERFARRTNSNLPAPLAAAIERKHGAFDSERHDLRVGPAEWDAEEICGKIMDLCGK